MARRNEHQQTSALAQEYLDELEGYALEVVLIPSNDPDCAMRGGMIRAVQSENAKWYREFCATHQSSRRRNRRDDNDTMIKRQWTRRALTELISGGCRTVYAHRVKQFIRKWDREHGRIEGYQPAVGQMRRAA
jgi:hypothetical protein